MLTEGETGQSCSEAAVGMCELGEGPFGEAEMWRLWMVLEENEVMAVCLCKQYLGAGAGFDILPPAPQNRTSLLAPRIGVRWRGQLRVREILFAMFGVGQVREV